MAAFAPPAADVFSAAQALELPGGWVVLDGRGQQLVFLDPGGRVVRRVSGPGEGPGELSRAVGLARVDSTLVTVDETGETLNHFGTDGAFLGRVRVPPADCAIGAVREVLSDAEGLVLLRTCTRGDGSTSARVERVSLAGDVHLLAERRYNVLGRGRLDPARFPVLAAPGGRIYLGVAPDRCVSLVGAEDAPRLCHPETSPPPLPDSVVREFRKIELRLRALGADVVVPERYPPFDQILALNGQLAFRVVLGEGRWALDVHQGDALARLLPPAGVRVLPGSRSLLLARELLEGTAFAVVRLP